MSTKTRHHSIGGDRRMSKELVNLRDKVGWMEEGDRAPLGRRRWRSPQATAQRTRECGEWRRIGVMRLGGKQLGEITPVIQY